jgi:hypothetical protein
LVEPEIGLSEGRGTSRGFFPQFLGEMTGEYFKPSSAEDFCVLPNG